MDKKVKITLLKSKYGIKADQRATLEALGLRKIRQTVEQTDNVCIRGMIDKVKHLVSVE